MPFIGRRTDNEYVRAVSQWMRENDIHPVDKCLGWAIVPSICLSEFKGNIKPIDLKDCTYFERPTYLFCTRSVGLLSQVDAFMRVCASLPLVEQRPLSLVGCTYD